jgi:peptide/nickel transport system permease protein
MLNFIFSRFIFTIVVLLILSFLIFSLLQIMPGDPAVSILGIGASPEQITELRHEMWLDRPFFIQYEHWMWNMFHGDLGQSYIYKEPITSLFAERLPVTLYLSFLSLIVSAILGILFGVICGVKRGKVIDKTLSVFANTGLSIPIFWLGILGIYCFGLILGWLPIQGWTSPVDNFSLSVRQTIMPVICLSVSGIAILTRQTRSSILEVVRQDYIRTAWAKGLGQNIILFRHVLKNSLIPVVTLMGIHLRVLVGGSVLVETVFNIPGMGRLLVSSVFAKDVLVVQAVVLMIGAVVGLANLLVDLSYGWLDPRIRYE